MAAIEELSVKINLWVMSRSVLGRYIILNANVTKFIHVKLE
jgi:hypothetical protein